MHYILAFLLILTFSSQALAAKTFTYSKWYVAKQQNGSWTYTPVTTYSDCQSQAASANTGTTTAWCYISQNWSDLKKYTDDPASNMAALPGIIE